MFDIKPNDYLIISEESLPVKDSEKILGKLANYFQDKAECRVLLLDGLTVVGSGWRFNLRVSLTENKLRLNFQARKERLQARTTEEMKPVLYDKNYNFCNDDNPYDYYMLRGEPSITVLPSKMLGREFNKTLGHFHKKGQGETYQIIFGKGLFLLQDRQNKIKMVKAETGDSLQIPPGYAHTLINLGKTVLVAADNSLGPEMNDYLPILAKHGFFYYVLKEGNRIKLVKNSAY